MESVQSRMLNINIGILGHVDSGKTSLVKALSTSLSTAALDKSSQSQQRGITLDLGFSAFSMTIPPHLVEEAGDQYDNLQFTLVDCPGHASLIKTIIGGAQIIDMIVLVIDINKGIQTQTAECIVIGEITTEKIIVVLNKVDMIPLDSREEKVEKMKNKLRKVFSSTKFADPVFVLTSAAVGGEKVAAVVPSTTSKDTEVDEVSAGGNSKSKKGSKNLSSRPPVQTHGVDTLIEVIRSSIRMPRRNYDGPFYFAIDHCFPIKGHGTVLTGTILSGAIQINSTVELPLLQLQRKVKSMQMFRKPVKAARQGDRLGMCVANLDAKLVERGIATTPSSVPLLSTVICLVKKVRFFKFPCKSNTKFHITIGHTTVNANAVFFGKEEILNQLKQQETDQNTGEKKSQASSLSVYHTDFPNISFPWDQDFEYQDELEGAPAGDMHYGNEPYQWVLLQFQQPVYCPLGSLIIGSRLETIEGSDAFGGSAQHCRLSFYGPIVTSMNIPKTHSTSSTGKAIGPNPLEALKLFRWKQKDCDVHRVIDVRGGRCREAIGYNLYSKEAGNSIRAYLGMKLQTADGELVGVIQKAFGSTNKFRIQFPNGAVGIKNGTKLFLRFKRYVYDTAKLMRQTGMEFTNPPNAIGVDFTFNDNDDHSVEEDDEEDVDVDDKVDEDNDHDSIKVAAQEQVTSVDSVHSSTTQLPEFMNVPKDGSNVKQDIASPDGQIKKSNGILLPSNGNNSSSSRETVAPASKPVKNVISPPTSKILHVSSPTTTKKSHVVPGVKAPLNKSSPKGSKNKANFEAVNLSMLGQKRAVVKAPTKNNTNQQKGQLSSASTGSWAQVAGTGSSVSTTGGPVENKRVGETDISTEMRYATSDTKDKTLPSNERNGPNVKSDYHKHVLEHMQATNPYVNIKANHPPVVTPTSNLKYDYTTASLPTPPKTNPGPKIIKQSSSGSGNRGAVRTGTIDSIKETPEGDVVAIVSGAFRMEENIRLFAGSSVVDANGCVVGEMIGPFAKMGKCKVKFSSIEEGGISVAHLPALKSSLSIVLPSDTAAN